MSDISNEHTHMVAHHTELEKIYILHVLGSLNRGGIETWLKQMLPYVDHDRFQIDFCCLGGEPGLYAAEIELQGSQIYPCRLTNNLVRFNAEFARILAHKPYTIVHSHVHQFSGYVLWRAAQAGVRTRIAHSFTTPRTSCVPPWRRSYMRVMSWLIDRYATAGLGNARTSLQSLYGIDWQTDPRWRLMYLGIDLVPFEQSVDRMDVCQQYGLPATASIIGHVGRLTPAKNHRFIIDIAAEIERQCDNIWFVLAGDGPLYSEILDYARQKHVTHLVMTGGVAETRSLYGIMDLFLFPSLWEGLPQAVVEAQAAGLRCLCANTITPEVSVVSEAVRFMDLAEGPTKWAAACQELLSLQKLDPDQARIAVSVSPFSIEYSASQLTQLYVSMQSLTMNAGT